MSVESIEPGQRRGMAAKLSVIAPALAVVGVALSYLGLVPPFAGFVLMGLGLLAGIAGAIVGAIGASRGRAGQGFSAAVCAATVVAILLPAFSAGGLPRINDITTDVEDPPVFVHAGTLGPNVGRDMAYPGEEFARQQVPAYPNLSHVITADPPEVVFDRVRAALASLPGTEVTFEDRATGHIEGKSTSTIFRFVDDIVVRIRPFESGSKIDVRSKSRDGKGDLGANAARIKALFAALAAGSGQG